MKNSKAEKFTQRCAEINKEVADLNMRFAVKSGYPSMQTTVASIMEDGRLCLHAGSMDPEDALKLADWLHEMYDEQKEESPE